MQEAADQQRNKRGTGYRPQFTIKRTPSFQRSRSNSRFFSKRGGNKKKRRLKKSTRKRKGKKRSEPMTSSSTPPRTSIVHQSLDSPGRRALSTERPAPPKTVGRVCVRACVCTASGNEPRVSAGRYLLRQPRPSNHGGDDENVHLTPLQHRELTSKREEKKRKRFPFHLWCSRSAPLSSRTLLWLLLLLRL